MDAQIDGLSRSARRTEIVGAARTAALTAELDAVKTDVLSLAYSNGSYTPTLTGMVIGTGGSAANSASWSFVGGPDVGDVGVLQWEWRLVFGTSGATFPTTPTITIPAGFNFTAPNLAGLFPVGICFMQDADTAANSRFGTLSPVSLTTVRLVINGHSAATGGVTTTTPFTWAINDVMQGSFSALVVRV